MGGQMAGMVNQMGNQFQQQQQQQAATPPPPPPAPATFMVYANGAQAGPFDMNQLAQMAAGGQLTPATFVWRQGMANWTAASQVPELQTLFAPATPPPPPMPPMPGM